MHELLKKLAELNVKIGVKENQLLIDAPAGVLTDELRESLRTHKQGLITLLSKSSGRSTVDISLPQIVPDILNRYQAFPLNDVQHAYWMGRNHRIELGNVATHFYFEVEAQDLDINRLNQALCRVIEHHDMLRAILDADGQQRIQKSVNPYNIAQRDLSHCTTEEKEIQLSAIRAEMSQQVLPVDQWPLFEVRATQLSDTTTRLHFSWDFIIVDAWSMFIIFRQWHDLYREPALVLPKISISYRDYVLAERKLKESEFYARAHDYWWQRIDTLPAAPMIPVKSQLDRDRKHPFVRRRFRLEAPRWQAIKSKAQAMGITPSNILLSAFAEVLTYWSKRPHYTLNLTLFNRLPLHDEVDQLVGDFTSLSLVEIDHRTGGTSFSDRALAIQQQFFKDLEHRQLSGVEVLREWSKRRGYTLKAAMPVVFTSSLVVASRNQDDAGVLEKWGPMIYGITQTPQVWLDHQVFEQQGELVFNWDAVEEVFVAGVLDAMFDNYCRLLENLATSSDYWLRTSVVTLPPEQHAQRQRINDTAAEMSDELLHTLFIQQALKNPQAIAIASNEGEMCYGELLALSNQLAQRLCEKGVRPNQLIAIVMDKGWQQIVAALGILISGAAYLPIDAELPKARHHQLFKQSGATLAITQPSLVNHLVWPDNVDCLVVDSVDFSESSSWDIPFLNSAPKTRQQITDLAYVIFTSGSTGVPKGVMIDHRGAVNTVLHINRLFQVTQHDRVLAVSSLSFDLSVYDIFGLLAAGGCIVLPDATNTKDPSSWQQLMVEHDVTIWNSAPALMSMLVDSGPPPIQTKTAPLRLAFLSGDWIPLSLPDRVRELFSKCNLISLGGATEASIWSIYYPIQQVESSWKSIPYGKPLPNQTIHVLNASLQPCPQSVVGYIYIGGIGLALGYWEDSKKTETHFITHPESGERLYYTGDLGRYLESGDVEFLGREDSQIKVRGHRIELGEIAAVLRDHEAVEEAVVIADGDSRTEQSLWAYLQVDSTKRSLLMKPMVIDSEQIRAYWQALIGSLKKAAKQMPATPLDDNFEKLWNALDELYVKALISAILNMGLYCKSESYTVAELLQQTPLASRYQRWMARALTLLADQGLLVKHEGVVRTEDRYFAPKPLPSIALEPFIETVEQQLSSVLGFTLQEARWFTQTSVHLSSLLTESTHSAEIYTADETALIYQKLFPDSHIQLRRAVKTLVDNRTQAHLNVLEVGAGLGSATSHILPLLPESSTTYDFTDISEYFLRQAKVKFSEYGFVNYHLFDLDDSPSQQGYKSHAYDLIIASSMLHDVRNLVVTLNHLLSLLAPGGLLLLLEETKFFVSYDLGMGLQQGFDRFTDESLRTDHPLLSRQQWQEVMTQVGFKIVEILNEPGSVADYVGFDVILAQAPDQVEQLDEPALDQYLLAHLPAYMKPTAYIVLSEFPVSENGKIDYKALAIRPTRKGTASKAKIIPPKNVTESKLLAIWKEVLACDTLGVQHNFFDAGGDSLLLVQVRNQIQQVFDLHLSTTVLFEHTTIRELSHYLTNSANEKTDFSENRERASKQRAAMMQRHRQIKEGV